MIAKHVSMKTVQKSDFAGLVKYITDEQAKNERVGYVAVTNCHTDQPNVAITEVLNTQAQNTRSGADKTYHLIVSFRPSEQPGDAILKAIEARICDGLGFGEHQRVSAVHHDTDNLHMHIAINKIHPTRYTILEPFNAYHTLSQLCEKLEWEYGLESDNHQSNKLVSEGRAQDMERHAGVESLQGWVKRECAADMRAAPSWDALHQIMQVNGLALRERGNGLVIQAADGLSVKASSIGREFSKAQLEEKLGTFKTPVEHLKPAALEPRRQYDKQPMRSRINTVELHAQYKADQLSISGLRTIEWEQVRAKKDRLIEAAKRSGRLKRSTIKLVASAGVGKKLMYSATSKTLKAEIEKANKQYLQERQEIYKKYQRRAWADWLRARADQGDPEALRALRGREAAQGLHGSTVSSRQATTTQITPANRDSITKKGTIIYRVGPTAIRDDGDRLKVSRHANHDGLQAVLRMALERYGASIRVSGTAAFQEQIAQVAAAAKLSVTFDDSALERRRQELSNQLATKENEHGQTESVDQNKEPDRGRADSHRNGGAGRAATGIHAVRNTGDVARDQWTIGRTPFSAHRHARQPNVGRIGRKPPPQSQNRLRSLSQLGVVHIASGGEVLLPRDVPRDMEQQGAQSADGLRRDIFGAGRVANAQSDAADKYIAEREGKRLKNFDIPKHYRYTDGQNGSAIFAGVRQVEGQLLALLKQGEGILVLPIDEPTARRLKRLAVGDALTVTSLGFIETKGRSR